MVGNQEIRKCLKVQAKVPSDNGNIPFWNTSVPDRSVGVTAITHEQFRHLPSELHRTAVRILIQQGEWRLVLDGQDTNPNPTICHVGAGGCYV